VEGSGGSGAEWSGWTVFGEYRFESGKFGRCLFVTRWPWTFDVLVMYADVLISVCMWTYNNIFFSYRINYNVNDMKTVFFVYVVERADAPASSGGGPASISLVTL
jgi:hypothetical protein